MIKAEINGNKTLSQIQDGKYVEILGVEGGRSLRSQLAAMGILPNTRVLVIRNGGAGPFVISVKNCRMVVGRGVADKIKVALEA